MSNNKMPVLIHATKDGDVTSIEKQLVVIDNKLYTLHSASLTPGYSKGPVRRVLSGGVSGLEKKRSGKPKSDEMRAWTSPISALGPNMKVLADAIIKRWKGVEWGGMPWVVVSDNGIAFLPEQLTDSAIINHITINTIPAAYHSLPEFVGKYCSHVFLLRNPLTDSDQVELPGYANGLYVTSHEGALFSIKAGKARPIPLDQVGVAVDFNLTYEEFTRDEATNHMLRSGFTIDVHSSTMHGRRLALCTPSDGEKKNCVAILRFLNR